MVGARNLMENHQSAVSTSCPLQAGLGWVWEPGGNMLLLVAMPDRAANKTSRNLKFCVNPMSSIRREIVLPAQRSKGTGGFRNLCQPTLVGAFSVIVKLQTSRRIIYSSICQTRGPALGLTVATAARPPLVSTRCKCFFCSFVIISVIIVLVSAVYRVLVNLVHFFL